MAISFTKYVAITSGVGGGAGVRQRDLIGRLFTSNELVPTDSIVEFTTLEDVGTYFGTTSDEYKRAAFYFGWISKNITRAQKISFAHWSESAVAPKVFGDPKEQALASWTSITTGDFSLTMGAFTFTMSALDFSAAASLANVASIIQTAIRAKTGGGTLWTSATVSYDAVRKSFNLVGGSTGPAAISVAAGTVTDIAGQLGWLSGEILSPGTAVQSITDVLDYTTDISNNFGSFLFMPALDDGEVEEAATWVDGKNVMFMYCVPTTAADADDYFAMLKDYGGVSVTLSAVANEYPEMVPMIILAATDYTRQNSVQNYMFQQFILSPSVTTTQDSNEYDNIRVNYYGRTQTAGQFIDFYQRGVLMGQATDPVDQNVYANEIWLKDAAGARIMELLLALSRVSANTQGRSQLLAILQSVIDQGLFNGTISVGKPLTTTQKLYIGEVTGDPLAWHQVQNIGYWVNCVMQSYTTQDGRTEWKAIYTLVYSKDDAIRKVEGSHILI